MFYSFLITSFINVLLFVLFFYYFSIIILSQLKQNNMAFLIIFYIGILVLLAISGWKIYEKAGRQGSDRSNL